MKRSTKKYFNHELHIFYYFFYELRYFKCTYFIIKYIPSFIINEFIDSNQSLLAEDLLDHYCILLFAIFAILTLLRWIEPKSFQLFVL